MVRISKFTKLILSMEFLVLILGIFIDTLSRTTKLLQLGSREERLAIHEEVAIAYILYMVSSTVLEASICVFWLWSEVWSRRQGEYFRHVIRNYFSRSVSSHYLKNELMYIDKTFSNVLLHNNKYSRLIC